ncbi:succinoglycan biosynthesis protein ExoA [Sphingomonas guangdongensis]|uniref:Succinoglycan biosynthesis protein ExoA n=1 Tax=Sphingomonas guangdongensis TaxID=1141890 RepID=A0A285QGN5_9SPHN|nr:glycosyltransferase family 2 protein [Sphingomonas guangdongensis]SOB81110.1 succinoglycan biosynthesis protein ExoA [Sphingomonas guangdongensis]
MTRDFADVLVVIPCLNEEAHLPGLLEVLLRDTPGATIAVADGGSSDASRAIVSAAAERHPAVRLVDNPDRLQSAGVNRAAARLGENKRWLVRVDAHCHYPRNYVAGLITAAERTGANSVVVPMRSIGGGCFQRAAATAQNSRLGTGGSPHRHVGVGAFVDHGHHALFEMERFQALGGYDERFPTNEDAEFDHRQTMSGARIWLEPRLALDYLPRATPPALFRQYLRYGQGRALTIRRHRMRPKLRQLLPLAPPLALVLACAAPWLPIAALPAVAWTLASLGYGLVLGLAARDGCMGASGVAAMIMHVAWGVGFLSRYPLKRLTKR